MTRDEAREALEALNSSIATAVLLIRSKADILARFLAEDRHMENFGPILDPTLFRDPERAEAAAILKPVYQAASDLVAAYDRQETKLRAALAQRATVPPMPLAEAIAAVDSWGEPSALEHRFGTIHPRVARALRQGLADAERQRADARAKTAALGVLLVDTRAALNRARRENAKILDAAVFLARASFDDRALTAARAELAAGAFPRDGERFSLHPPAAPNDNGEEE